MGRFTLSAQGLVAALALMVLASPAQAYIGPGAGLTAIGAFIAFVVAIIVAIVAFVWFPIRRAMRKARASKTALQSDTAADDDD